jgi:integrase
MDTLLDTRAPVLDTQNGSLDTRAPAQVATRQQNGVTMGRKRKLPACVEQVGNKYRSHIPSGVRGKKHWLPAVDTPEEAEQLRKDALSFRESGCEVRADWTFEQVCDATEERLVQFRKQGTVDWFRANRRAVEKALRTLGYSQKTLFIHLDQPVWCKLRDLRREEVSANSVRHHFRVISMIYTWALKNGVVATSPLPGVELPPTTVREMDYLTEDEFWDVIDYIETSGHDFAVVDAAMFAILFLTGMRFSELVRVQIEDLHIDRQNLWVWGKRRDETMGFPADAAPYFLDLIGDRTEGPLLEKGAGMLKRAFNRWVSGRSTKRVDPKIKRKVGVKRPKTKHHIPGLLPDEKFGDIKRRMRAHALRHSFVTALVPRLVEKNMTPKEMMQLCRLKSHAMLDRYLHVTADPRTLDVLQRRRRAPKPLAVVRTEEPQQSATQGTQDSAS